MSYEVSSANPALLLLYAEIGREAVGSLQATGSTLTQRLAALERAGRGSEHVPPTAVVAQRFRDVVDDWSQVDEFVADVGRGFARLVHPGWNGYPASAPDGLLGGVPLRVLDQARGDGWGSEVLDFLFGDVWNFWSGGTDGFPYGALTAGTVRSGRTAYWVIRQRKGASFPTFNTGLLGRGLTRVMGRTPGLARSATWMRTAGATRWFARGAAVGGAVSTTADVKTLIDQGNPVEAFNREGAGYVADVARTGFSASTTAFFVAPNPVTGGAVVVTGVTWAGAEVVDHWDTISGAFVDAWDAGAGFVTDLTGDAKTVASSAWDGTTERAAAAWSDVADGASDAWDGTKNLASGGWQGTKDVAGGAWGFSKDVAGVLNPAGWFD